MSALYKIGKSFKSIKWIKNNDNLRSRLRSMAVFFSRIIHSNGVSKNIGGFGEFMMDCEFTFCNYESWGTGHNNGFNKLVSLARKKKIVFDVGAHIGLCSLPISRVLAENGSCFAFEPAEVNLKYLSSHLKMNNIENVKVIPHLLGEKPLEKVNFFIHKESSGMSSVCRSKKKLDLFKEVQKKQVTIDDFVQEHNCIPELLKIDVEGAEMSVLLGGEKVLKKYHPQIILSVHPKQIEMMGYTLEDLIKIIHSFDYEILNIDNSKLSGPLELKEYFLN